MLAIRDMVLRNDNPLPLLVNCANLPVFILHGGDDDNVPTLHGRSFAGWLKELGYRCTYKEVPGRSHWWSYESLQVSVLDDPDLMAFLKEQKRDPWPEHIRFRSADLAESNRSYWAIIERAVVAGRDAELEAWGSDSLVRVKTTNVARFRLDLGGARWATGDLALEIDGVRLPGRFEPGDSFVLGKSGKGWQRPTTRDKRVMTKTHGLHGPAKQVMMSPFLLVYGTRDPASVRFLRHVATQEALRWWPNGNGLAEVLPDSEVTPGMIQRYNLVLYGGATENRLTSRIAARLPVQVRDGRMWLGRTALGDSLAALVTYPNPLNPAKLVLERMGTDAPGVRLSLFWGIAGPSTGVPDFMVFDRSVRRYGWAGVRAAGFFNPDWQLDPASMYVR
jgi:hypothetical protein